MLTEQQKELANRALVAWAKSLPLANQLRRDKEELLKWVKNRLTCRAETAADYVLKAKASREAGGGDEWFLQQAEWFAGQAAHYRELLDWASTWLFRSNYRTPIDVEE